MSIFQQLMEKPWLNDQDAAVDLPVGRLFSLPIEKLGLRVFLTVVMVLFTLFVSAYLERMVFSDWQPLSLPWLLWPNTLILIAGSGALQWAWVSTRQGRMDGLRRGFLIGGILTFAFLVGQLLAWQELAAAGDYTIKNPAHGFFFVLTAAHGIHLLGGLVAWNKTMTKIRRGYDITKLRMSVELCVLYWHFLLMLWLVLFALLLVT